MGASVATRDQVWVRRTYVRSIIGDGYTNGQMLDKVNDYLADGDMPQISLSCLQADLKVLRQDFRDAVAGDTVTRAQEIDADLMVLQQRQTEDYLKRRQGEKSTALDSDNIRKTIVERGKLAGVFVEKHQHDGKMTIEHHLKEILSIKPDSLEVLDLLPDEEYSIAPRAKIAADG